MMTWKPIDFQGIVKLDTSIVEHLRQYLEEKESQLSHAIINSIHTLPRETLPPVIPFNTNGRVKLSEAVEAFGKQVRQILSTDRQIVPLDDWKTAKQQINSSLWEYVEVLEGGVTELFQQLGQIGFEEWHEGLKNVVDAIKEVLLHRIEETIWAIKRLEDFLWQYRWDCENREGMNVTLRKIWYFWRSLLDRTLTSYLKKSEKFLKIRYKWFAERYVSYHKTKNQITQSLSKFSRYHIFKTFDEGTQHTFKKVYELIKLWLHNEKTKALPEREPILALRSFISIDKATTLFIDYIKAIRQSVFDKSRLIKTDPQAIYGDKMGKPFASAYIVTYRSEIHTLGATISRFRDFYLKTHPNPYIRTRWGFGEWVVGPEPAKTKKLMHLVYEVERLDELYKEFGKALEKGPDPKESVNLARQYREVQSTLHEMGQPLTSRSLMRGRAEKLLWELKEMDELGSFDPAVVDYVGKAFSKALRIDWQYHVLFDIPMFHELYRIHQGLTGPCEDRDHIGRMNKFKELIEQLKGWVQNRDTHRHVSEIEFDMNDMKGYLQDFLAQVQRSSKEEENNKAAITKLISETAMKLLEYRYLFAGFFHYLHKHEPEGKLMRNQFLFVDQYFETVENKLHQLRSEWK